MALTHTRAKEVAEHAVAVSNETKVLLYRIAEFLTMNSNQSIDWGAVSKPAYLNEDVAGNIDGTGFTRQQLSNAIGSLDTIKSTLDAAIGNLNQLAKSDA
jgi:hypothetical protein